MNRAAGAGAVCTVGGLAGYVAGIVIPYPGRSFSITALMIGITLLAIGRTNR